VRLAVVHLTAAVVVSFVWALIARGLALALSSLERFRGLDQQVLRIYPLLLGSGGLLYLLAVALHYVLLSDEELA